MREVYEKTILKAAAKFIRKQQPKAQIQIMDAINKLMCNNHNYAACNKCKLQFI